MIGCLPTQALAFLAVFVYATQAIAFEWKPGFTQYFMYYHGYILGYVGLHFYYKYRICQRGVGLLESTLCELVCISSESLWCTLVENVIAN